MGYSKILYKCIGGYEYYNTIECSFCQFSKVTNFTKNAFFFCAICMRFLSFHGKKSLKFFSSDLFLLQ